MRLPQCSGKLRIYLPLLRLGQSRVCCEKLPQIFLNTAPAKARLLQGSCNIQSRLKRPVSSSRGFDLIQKNLPALGASGKPAQRSFNKRNIRLIDVYLSAFAADLHSHINTTDTVSCFIWELCKGAARTIEQQICSDVFHSAIEGISMCDLLTFKRILF